MSDETKKPQVPAEKPPAAPERRSTLPAAPPERRTTEIDKQRVPMAAKPYRLLALVKQDAVVRVQKEPDDTVMVWPHLLAIEFFAAAVMSVFMLFMGVFVNAPLEELANSIVTPAVAKAPWYFVGLQELLAYFHPTVAGVLAPTVILVGAALVPFIDRGPKGDGGSPRPSDRKVGVMLFTLFMGAGLTITFLGAFFRGPGYAWTLPWEGFFFAL
jgi:menaquinol-cytochrome c reductase cytochrome b/c subunit